MKKLRIMKVTVLFWTLFIGVGAVWGSACMLLKPDGSLLQMQTLLPYFQVLPFADILFQNYIFPGISLLIVNGISNLTAAFLIIRNRKIGAILGFTFGITLMLWITIQFIVFPKNILSISYFIFGVLQFICGYYYYVLFCQNQFQFKPADYPNIGTNKNVLVVFYSRMGYVKKIAYEKANAIGAEIYQITTPELTKGFLGFAWLGRFGMHRWAMKIDEVKVNLKQYKKIIVVSPVHVFRMASPVRGFLEVNKGMISSAEYILVHFRFDNMFKKAFDEMDELLNIKATKRESIVCKFGIVKKVKQF